LFKDRDYERIEEAFYDFFLNNEPNVLGRVPFDRDDLLEMDFEWSFGYCEF